MWVRGHPEQRLNCGTDVCHSSSLQVVCLVTSGNGVLFCWLLAFVHFFYELPIHAIYVVFLNCVA